jgi:hypothetical protein
MICSVLGVADCEGDGEAGAGDDLGDGLCPKTLTANKNEMPATEPRFNIG